MVTSGLFAYAIKGIARDYDLNQTFETCLSDEKNEVGCWQLFGYKSDYGADCLHSEH